MDDYVPLTIDFKSILENVSPYDPRNFFSLLFSLISYGTKTKWGRKQLGKSQIKYGLLREVLGWCWSEYESAIYITDCRTTESYTA